MRRLILAGLTLLASAGILGVTSFDPALRAQEAAVFKDPFATVSQQKAPAAPGSYVQNIIRTDAPGKGPQAPVPVSTSTPVFKERVEINKDILVTPAQGPWLICLTNYQGDDAAKMARQMALEIKSVYKVNTYVFNYGEEEQQKEHERAKAIVDKQREFLEQNQLPLGPDQKIRVRTVRIDEQCGVLIGGYPTEEAAKKELERLRKAFADHPLDTKRVPLATEFYAEGKTQSDRMGNKLSNPNVVYVSPFKTAFVTRNPSLPKDQRPADLDKVDVALLKNLNAGEPYSLFNVKKPVTLVVKQIPVPAHLENSSSSAGGMFGQGAKAKVDAGDKSDFAYNNAHALCECLRAAKLDAYVLHTKYSSIVCVGAFDGIEDAQLRSMQSLLQSKLPALQEQLAAGLRVSVDVIAFMPTPLPMNVPR